MECSVHKGVQGKKYAYMGMKEGMFKFKQGVYVYYCDECAKYTESLGIKLDKA